MQILYVPGMTSSNTGQVKPTENASSAISVRHQVYQSHAVFPVRCIVAQKIEKEELTKALEEKILALDGSTEEIERHIERFGCCFQASKR